MLALLARIDPVAGMRSLEAPAVQEAILDAMRQAGIPAEVDYHPAVLQRLLCGDESMPLQTLLGCMADLAQHPESERCTRDKRLLAEAMRKAVVRLCWQT
ncbi:hypothetical protein GT347_04730 [Xylophilus rhododendri]|uniref:Uncharacterized protein n=1 Tax=Xylophilus rhododendri TaxID=2697032 RepID=A0A857J0V9_9BURK|nr:hypothetical protein [Xylophilus rhododendri]QHI97346.1 hypothetical protein GT347_04730 [Xylophilus rhododendri]